MRYTGRRLQAISFPLGGIGTGSIGLAGNGQLIDWEIRNRPSKQSYNGFSFFAVKAEKDGAVVSAKVLQGDHPMPWQGQSRPGGFGDFGYGPDRATLAGVPHFASCAFEGEFPFAKIEFSDPGFPGKPALHAFNPMIPSNTEDSEIPAAFFTITVSNDTDSPLDYTLAACLQNMGKSSVNRESSLDKGRAVILSDPETDTGASDYGEMLLATDCEDSACQEYWFRGMWFDSLSVFWQDFNKPGHLQKRAYKNADQSDVPGKRDVCAISAHMRLQPGETSAIRFLIAWRYPNYTNYWNPLTPEEQKSGLKNSWTNYYALRFESVQKVAAYAFANWERLEGQTSLFHDALFASSLPDYCLDAISSTMSVLKTATCIRLSDGSFYGWEGLHSTTGSCEGTCTHVWNYAYAVPFLYPALERTIRETNYRYNQDPSGGMRFRTQLPLGRKYSAFRPCADGQFGDVLKVYREWKICGSDEWLKQLWPKVKKSIEYAWHPDNPDRWDLDHDGVLEGRQHHTLDMELFGPSSWLNGFYIAALKAGCEMAKALGDGKAAEEYAALYQRGRAWMEAHLFNGEYFIHQANLDEREVLKPYGDAYDLYWNSEAKEIKYQIGEGCSIDQLTAQWHANNMGLGQLLDADKVKKALLSIYRYNFICMREHFNPCRLFSLNDEKGTVMCTWPKNVRKPVIPVPYAEETMYGFEYQAAVSMLQNGLIDEGLELIKSIRERHNGENRNPWNEMECGSNYARSMAAYSILLALSGFEYDMTKRHVGFMPRINQDAFQSFWALDGAWGLYAQSGSGASLRLLYGKIRLNSFRAGQRACASVKRNDVPIHFREKDGTLYFDDVLELNENDELIIGFAPAKAQ